MKVTVNKNVNARIGAASTFAACESYKTPSSIIEVDDVVIGTEIDGNAVWYHCKDDGNYYWSGGVEEVEFLIEGNTLADKDFLWVISSIKNDKSFILGKKVRGYKGLGIGHKNNDGKNLLCLTIFVESKIDTTLLDFIVPDFLLYKGIKVYTDVKEIKNPSIHTYINNNPELKFNPDYKSSPMGIGGSISREYDLENHGTRCIRVMKGNEYYLMTCFHVLLREYIKDGNKDYFFPSEEVKNLNSVIPSNELYKKDKKNQKKYRIAEGDLSAFYDYALVKLDNELNIQNTFKGNEIIDYVKFEEINTLLDKKVYTIGASSYIQSGKITELRSEILLDCFQFTRQYHSVLISEKISIGGDSGAPVFTIDHKLVGYIVGGNEDDISVILPFYQLALNKSITLK